MHRSPTGLVQLVKRIRKHIIKVLLLFLMGLLISDNLYSQLCFPMPGEICEEAPTLCSLDAFSNYECMSIGTEPLPCNSSCTNGKIPSPHTAWYGFMTQGGNVTINIHVGGCWNHPYLLEPEIKWGIWGDCRCGEEVFCSNPCVKEGHSQSATVNLKPCKKYYLWITGCDGEHPHWDSCTFWITTSGGGPPILSQLGYINNNPKGIIGPICAGACNYKFFVEPLSGGCDATTYLWTLDGDEVGDNNKEIRLDFPDPGDFKICVTSYMGDPKSGAVCAHQGPKCAIVKVRPKPEPIDFYYITCDNKPYVDILGRTYLPCKNQFEISLRKPSDPDICCDSTIRLTAIDVKVDTSWKAICQGNKVEISPNVFISKPCSVGESYKFEYSWYKKNDTLKKIISTNDSLLVDPVNEDYCVDVNVRVDLATIYSNCLKTFCESINEVEFKDSAKSIVLSFCDSALINGQTYNQSTQFTQKLKNIFGCDSTINTQISIQKSSKTDLVFNSCDSVIFNGTSYTQSGNYAQVLQNTNLCDSVLNLNISIGKISKTDLALSSCDSIIVNGQKYFLSGNYSQALFSSIGCDSILNLDLTIPKSSRQDFSFNSCDSVFFNGKTYTKSGYYSQTFVNKNGCDSILGIHVNITNSNNSPLKVTYCDSVTINGSYYTLSGNYTQKLKSVNGCDSTLNIELTIAKSNSSLYKLTSCDSALINSQWFLQSGIYLQTLINANQCDSLLNIDLNITKSTSGDTLFRSCDSVTINGQTYRLTGIYKQTLTNSNKCDSTLIIDFIQLSKSSTALNYKSCDSVVINNQIYKQSGNYTQTFVNANQCDSILNLDVTITNSNASNISLSSCDSMLVNGQLYKQSGLYIQHLQNAVQCDSLLNIDLTIHKNSTTNRSLSSCDSVVVNNRVYTLTGAYKQFLTDRNGCDSTLNLLVNVSNSSTSTLILTGCDSAIVNNQIYTLTGVYKQLLTNANGCDSSLTLDLTIKPGNPSALKAGSDTSICYGELIQLNGIFSGNAKFLWHSANGSFDNANNLSTNYYPTVIGDEKIYLQAADDCKQWLDSLAVHVLPKQIVQVTGDTLLNPCKEIRFTASGGTNYIWTPSSVIECLDPACSRIRLKSTTNLMFTISTDGPCAVSANLNLSLLKIQTDVYLPNVFSPNGDNINDVFLPIFNCEQVDYYNLQIFDRWGNLVFESFAKEKGWDGKYQELNMNPGVYPYVIQYELHNTGKKIKPGEVTLIR